MPKTREVEEAIAEQHTQYLKNQPTTLRRCLGCSHWMNSAGADHRICNTCRPVRIAAHGRVGERVL